MKLPEVHEAWIDGGFLRFQEKRKEEIGDGLELL